MKMQKTKSECREAVKKYIETYNPYAQTPSLGFNVAEVSRYAAKTKRKVSELSQEEIAFFATSK